jgi:hypothetical protein
MLLPLSALLLFAGPPAATPRFEGLDRLYFERVEDPGGSSTRAAAVRTLLPATLADTTPRTVSDVDMLAATDLALPLPGVVLRQVHDRGQRVTEQWWCLYEKGARRECWFFAPSPTRTDNKLLAEYTVQEVLAPEPGRVILRACGHVSRPQGAWWSHGKDLVFTAADGTLTLDYVVGRFSLSRGYDMAEGAPLAASTERLLEGGERIERRGVAAVPDAALARCGWKDGLEGTATCGELELVAQCMTAVPEATARSRARVVPSFAERGGRP